MIHLVPNRSALIVNTHFHTKRQSLQVDPSQTEHYFRVTISNSYSWWKIFSNGIYLLMFEVIYKKSCFLRQFMNWQLKLCLILCAGSSGTRNQDSRLLSNSFRCHESNGGLRQTSFLLKSRFLGKHYCLDLHKFSKLISRGSVLETKHTLGFVLMSRL